MRVYSTDITDPGRMVPIVLAESILSILNGVKAFWLTVDMEAPPPETGLNPVSSNGVAQPGKPDEEIAILRRRHGELLAANNQTEAQRREAVRQRDVARNTVQVLQEALHARNATIAKLRAELVAARRPAPEFPPLGTAARMAIAAACSDFMRRALERWQGNQYAATSPGLVRALGDEVDVMVAEAAGVQAFPSQPEEMRQV
jgi:hypothetical protein